MFATTHFRFLKHGFHIRRRRSASPSPSPRMTVCVCLYVTVPLGVQIGNEQHLAILEAGLDERLLGAGRVVLSAAL